MTKISFTAFSFSFSLKKRPRKKKSSACIKKKVYILLPHVYYDCIVFSLFFVESADYVPKRERNNDERVFSTLYNNLPEYYLKME